MPGVPLSQPLDGLLHAGRLLLTAVASVSIQDVGGVQAHFLPFSKQASYSTRTTVKRVKKTQQTSKENSQASSHDISEKGQHISGTSTPEERHS